MNAHRPRDGGLRQGCTAVNGETNRQTPRRHRGAVRTKGTIRAAPRIRPPEVSLDDWDHAEPTRPTPVAREVDPPRGDALPLVNPLFLSLIAAIALLLCLLVTDLLHPARTDSDGTGVGRSPSEQGIPPSRTSLSPGSPQRRAVVPVMTAGRASVTIDEAP
jgi:hypothetical protein